MTIELAAIVFLKILGGLAIIVLSAVIIMALLLRFLNKHPVDRDEDAEESELRANQIIAASEPAPLTMDEAYMRKEVRRVRGLS